MKHKTLKQKISVALYGAASFFMVLFTIGLILKTGILSRYPDGNEVYEIGRDALTLTAYFLAPVVALILFSDWRVEYKLKDDLIKIEEVNRLIIQIQKDIETYYSKIFTLKPDTNLKFNNLDDRQNILILIGNLSYLCKRVYLIGVVAQDFNESVSLLIKETNEALNQIHTMEFFNYELNKQELYDREYYEEIFDSAREISSLYMKNKQERYDQFFELFKKLRDSLLENT